MSIGVKLLPMISQSLSLSGVSRLLIEYVELDDEGDDGEVGMSSMMNFLSFSLSIVLLLFGARGEVWLEDVELVAGVKISCRGVLAIVTFDNRVSSSRTK